MALLGTLTTSVSALDSFTTGLDTVGNNIANINSAAFKGSTVSFSDTFSGVGTQVNAKTESFSQGALSSTGNPTDLGVSGNGFFVVKDPASSIQYATRDGQFHFDDTGYLVNEEGYRVQGLTGTPPSTLGDIKEATPPTGFARSGVSIDPSGNVIETYSDGTQVTTNQVLLQNFADPNMLQAQGNNLYSNLAGAGPLKTPMDASDNVPGSNGLGVLESGTLEQSNVDLTEQFSNMISLQRAFEANARMVTISDTILEDVVNMKSH